LGRAASAGQAENSWIDLLGIAQRKLLQAHLRL